MLLSDAIAMGRTLVKPTPTTEWAVGGGGCARGMALEAIGKRCAYATPYGPWESGKGHPNIANFLTAWPWTERLTSVPCLCYGEPVVAEIAIVISHMFDRHVSMPGCTDSWTLDQLIDWVRSVEPEELPEQQPTIEAAGLPAVAHATK